MSGLEHLRPLLCLQSDGTKTEVNTLFAEISHDGALYETGVHKQHLKNGTRPLGPVQPSAPPACLWVQGTDQEALGEGGCAVGAEVEDEA